MCTQPCVENHGGVIEYFEGQFEGQNAAKKGWPQPVAALASMPMAGQAPFSLIAEPVGYSW